MACISRVTKVNMTFTYFSIANEIWRIHLVANEIWRKHLVLLLINRRKKEKRVKWNATEIFTGHRYDGHWPHDTLTFLNRRNDAADDADENSQTEEWTNDNYCNYPGSVGRQRKGSCCLISLLLLFYQTNLPSSPRPASSPMMSRQWEIQI